MIAIILFMTGLAVVAGWWLSRQRLMAKPWLEVDAVGGVSAWVGSTVPVAKVGLGVFLAVAGCLFALLFSAYIMRIGIDTTPGAVATGTVLRPMPVPKLLWLNTAMLVLSSGALQCAHVGVGHGRRDAVRDGLLIGTVSAIVFLAGQLLLWRQFVDAGYFAASNPANAFFYVLTGIHGLHVVGGLVALGKTVTKVWRGVTIQRLGLSVWLCTVYWHFLLLIWLIVFALLTGWADNFIVICRALVI
jgi:cytochrome c oxidase subunit 3